MATINTDAPIAVKLSDTLLPEEDDSKKIALFQELDFKQKLDNIDAETQITEEKTIEISDQFSTFDFSNIESMDIRIRCFQDNYLKNEIIGLGMLVDGHTFVIHPEEITQMKHSSMHCKMKLQKNMCMMQKKRRSYLID